MMEIFGTYARQKVGKICTGAGFIKVIHGFCEQVLEPL